MEAIPADQGAVSVAATSSISLTRSYKLSPRVKQLLTSVVREICTLRSVGAGNGDRPRPPGGDQQWSSLPRQ